MVNQNFTLDDVTSIATAALAGAASEAGPRLLNANDNVVVKLGVPGAVAAAGLAASAAGPELAAVGRGAFYAGMSGLGWRLSEKFLPGGTTPTARLASGRPAARPAAIPPQQSPGRPQHPIAGQRPAQPAIRPVQAPGRQPVAALPAPRTGQQVPQPAVRQAQAVQRPAPARQAGYPTTRSGRTVPSLGRQDAGLVGHGGNTGKPSLRNASATVSGKNSATGERILFSLV